jgi:hypothetical protein
VVQQRRTEFGAPLGDAGALGGIGLIAGRVQAIDAHDELVAPSARRLMQASRRPFLPARCPARHMWRAKWSVGASWVWPT